MATTAPRPIANTVAGFVAAAVRIFIRAPILFTLLPTLQFLSTPLLGLVAPPTALPSFWRGAADFVIAQALLAVVQAPVIERASRLAMGEPAPLDRLVAVAVNRAWPMIVMTAVQLAIVTLGTIAFVIPGLVALMAFILAGPICVRERARPVESLRLSTELTRGIRWRLFGAFLCLLLPPILVMAGLDAVLPKIGATALVAEVVVDLVSGMSAGLLTVFAAVVYDAIRPAKAETRIAEVFG